MMRAARAQKISYSVKAIGAGPPCGGFIVIRRTHLTVLHSITSSIQIDLSNDHPFSPTGIGDDLPARMDDPAVTVVLSITHRTHLI
jgi:hypothetical protein